MRLDDISDVGRRADSEVVILIKITIEGWKEEAVVTEGITNFNLQADTGDKITSASKCTRQFMAFVAVQALVEFINAGNKEG